MTPIHRRIHAATGRPRRSAIGAAVAAGLGVLAAPQAFAQDAATSAQLQSLQQQVQQLQRQVDRLQQQQATTQTAGPAQPGGPPAPPAAETRHTKGPGLHAGPVTVTFGGFTELAGIYRDKNESADVGSNFSTGIPYPNSPNNQVSEFRESARQSRLSILAQGPHDGPTRVEGYFEMDFLGAAPTANSNESNSYNLRMRNIYATYAREDTGFYMLAGQSWSLATLYQRGLHARAENVPLTIDAQYVPGFNWTRNAQVRFVERFNDVLSAGISFESPQTLIFNGPNPLPKNTVFNNPGGSLFSSTNNYSFDVAPDIVAKVALDPGFGHYEIYGIGRWFRDRAAGVNDTAGGGGVGGGLIVPVVSHLLDFQLSGLAGSGIGRYGTSQLPDVTLTPQGTFATVREYDVLAGFILHPVGSLTLYAYAGEEHADSRDYAALVGTPPALAGYGYGSPLYDNSGCLTLGSGKCAANTRSVKQGTLGAWWKYYQGELGNLQFGIQGSYTKRETFSGVGGAPDTNLKVGMVSFRYYPYQK